MTNGSRPPTFGGSAKGSGSGGPGSHDRDRQITNWWQEVEAAMRRAHPARARRFLRWIVTCQPEEEEAWLVLAHLAPNRRERLQCLHRAYTFHPGSRRILSRLAEARAEFLESTVGELVRPRHLIRCLPDERRMPHPANGASRNGNHPDPLDQVGRTPGLLARLFHAIGGTE